MSSIKVENVRLLRTYIKKFDLVVLRVSDQSTEIGQFHYLFTNITVFANTPTYWPIRH